MTFDRIKTMVDTKIKVDFAKYTNDQIIAELCFRIDKYKELISKLTEKENTKMRYMSMWIEAAQERVLDVMEIKTIEKKVKLSRVKILELVDIRKKINN